MRTLTSDGLGERSGGPEPLEALVVCSPDVALLGRRLALDARVTIGRGADCTVPARDGRMSRLHAQLEATQKGVVVTDLGSRNGVQVDGQRLREAVVEANSVVRLGDTCLVIGPGGGGPRAAPTPLIGDTAPMRRLRAELARVAPSDLNVLVLGETGTGKEVVASELHRLGARSGDFVAVNCSAIPDTLLESALFGHVKGAFTGADTDAPGVFVRAHGGTLFLDEVGEMPLSAQPKLLRVLEDGLVHPVGAARPRSVKVRVVAATNRALRTAVAEGRFRADLYARLEAWVLELPALRERRADICALFTHFNPARPLTANAVEALLVHDWPFNVRELRTVAGRTEVSGEPGEPVRLDELGALAEGLRERREGDSSLAPPEEGLTRERIEEALRMLGGNVTRAARHLGCGRKTLYRRLSDYEIDPSAFRGPGG